MKIDLNLLPIFIIVAEERGFQAAATRLGVTRSAISQAMRRLEDAFGSALVTRTTRSVHLTEIGERFYQALARPLSDISAAAEAAAGETTPRGVLRVAVTSIAEQFLSGPYVALFGRAHPEVTLDVTVTDEELDIVAGGFDVGVRLGEIIGRDMIAVPLTGDQREAVVASPDYVAQHGAPQHPRELFDHRCIGWRPAPNVAPYRWQFEEDGVAFELALNPRVTTNDLRLMLRATLAGAGITFVTEEAARPYLDKGQLVSLLTPYLPPFPGFYLYYPQRRNVPPKLRALIEHTHQWRKAHLGTP